MRVQHAAVAYSVSAEGLAGEVAATVGWPAFAKPVRSSLAAGAGPVGSAQDLVPRLTHLRAASEEHMRARSSVLELAAQVLLEHNVDDPDLLLAADTIRGLRDYTLEETIPAGGQVTVDVAVDSSGVARVTGTSDSRMFEGTDAFEAFSFPASADHRSRVEDAAVEAALLLGLEGRSVNFEFRVSSGMVHLVEMNPRPAALYRAAYLLQGSLDLLTAYMPQSSAEGGQAASGSWDAAVLEIIRTKYPHQIAQHPTSEHMRELELARPGARYIPIAVAGRPVAEGPNPEGSYAIGVFLLPFRSSESREHVLAQALRITGMGRTV